jgi:hypothetical protein
MESYCNSVLMRLELFIIYRLRRYLNFQRLITSVRLGTDMFGDFVSVLAWQFTYFQLVCG